MGAVIKQYFVYARAEGGVPLSAKLAMKTCITSVIAEKIPDTAENIEKVRKALGEILPGRAIPDFRAP